MSFIEDFYYDKRRIKWQIFLLYVKKKEAVSLLHRTGHQLSGTMIPHDGFCHSIRESNYPVKSKLNNVIQRLLEASES